MAIRSTETVAAGTAVRFGFGGNGILDPKEVCDDGNTVSGDGCSSDCRSNETCGNSVVDVIKGEVCDDGKYELRRWLQWRLQDVYWLRQRHQRSK